MDSAMINKILEHRQKVENYHFSLAHPTQKRIIRGVETDIDEGMLLVVDWINSVDGAFTISCCQGDKRRAIVVFRATSAALEIIARVFAQYKEDRISFEISYPHERVDLQAEWYNGGMKYVAAWTDYLALQYFNDWLKAMRN